MLVSLKKLVAEIIQHGGSAAHLNANPQILNQLYEDIQLPAPANDINVQPTLTIHQPGEQNHTFDSLQHAVAEEESLSLIDKEADLIKKALKKHRGKRKLAAQELGISERTLYRKIKELNLN